MARKPTREEKAFALGAVAGARRGRQVALQDALELTARKLFEDESRLVLALLDQGTPEQVLEALPRLRSEVMEPRWHEVMRPLLAGIIAAQVSR